MVRQSFYELHAALLDSHDHSPPPLISNYDFGRKTFTSLQARKAVAINFGFASHNHALSPLVAFFAYLSSRKISYFLFSRY